MLSCTRFSWVRRRAAPPRLVCRHSVIPPSHPPRSPACVCPRRPVAPPRTRGAGPYYAHVAGTVSSDIRASLLFAVALSLATSLCLSALFKARYRLEDPFAPGERDAVDVAGEFGRMRAALFRARAEGGPAAARPPAAL